MQNATQSKATPIDWTKQEPARLLRAVLENDAAAWREFVRRFEPVLRFQIGRVLARHRAVLQSDAVDEIVSDFYLDILKNDMRKLRVYDPTRSAQLDSWLGLLASQAAIRHVRKAYRNAGEPGPAVVDRETDPNVGGEWLGRERDA
jgi:hypothetical protein